MSVHLRQLCYDACLLGCQEVPVVILPGVDCHGMEFGSPRHGPSIPLRADSPEGRVRTMSTLAGPWGPTVL